MRPNYLRRFQPGDDLLELPDHTLVGQGEVNLQTNRLSVEIINDIEQLERSAIFELVVHRVHRPCLIDTVWHGERLGLDAQVERQVFVSSVHLLVIPFGAQDVAQIQVTQAKAKAVLILGQTKQPVGQLGIFCILLALDVAALHADAKRLAGRPNAHAAFRRCFVGHLSPARWLPHVFSSASATISALSFSSRYIFFKLRCSS